MFVLANSLDASDSLWSGYLCRTNCLDNLSLESALEHLAVTIDVWPLLVVRFLIDDNGHTVDLVHYLRLISCSGHSFDFHGMNWVGSYKN